MAVVPHPSEYILRKAWQLGRRMACKDHQMGIDLTFCYQYSTYDAFRLANRSRLQTLPAMTKWEDRLQSIIEHAVNGLGYSLDNQRTWDAIEQLIVRPIRNAFWIGWEQELGLEAQYQQVVTAYRAKQSVHVLHVNRHSDEVPRRLLRQPTADLDAQEERGLWEKVARAIYDDLGVRDENQFWAATGSQRESDHTGDESLDNLPNVFGPIMPAEESSPEAKLAAPPAADERPRLAGEFIAAAFSA